MPLSPAIDQAVRLAAFSASDTLVQLVVQDLQVQVQLGLDEAAKEIAQRTEKLRSDVAEAHGKTIDQLHDLPSEAKTALDDAIGLAKAEIERDLRTAETALATAYKNVIAELEGAKTLAAQKAVFLNEDFAHLGLDRVLAGAIASGRYTESVVGYVERAQAATTKIREDFAHVQLSAEVLSALGVQDFKKCTGVEPAVFEAKVRGALDPYKDAQGKLESLLIGEAAQLGGEEAKGVAEALLKLSHGATVRQAVVEAFPKVQQGVSLLESFESFKNMKQPEKPTFNDKMQVAVAAVALAKQAAALIGNEQAGKAVEAVSKAVTAAQQGYELYKAALLITATGGVGAVFASMSFMTSASALGGMGGSDSNGAVLQAIEALRSYMEAQFKEIKQQLAGIRQQLDSIQWSLNQISANLSHVQWSLDVVQYQLGVLSLQSAQEAFAIAENTDQLELVRYQGLMAEPTMPPRLERAVCKQWLASRVEDAFDRLRIVKAEALMEKDRDPLAQSTEVLSTYLLAFAKNDLDGSSSAFPVDALVRGIIEFERIEASAARDQNAAPEQTPPAQGARFLRPLHKGVLLDAIERYFALLQAEARWEGIPRSNPTARPANGSRNKAKPATPKVPMPSLTREERRALSEHLTAFERGLSAAECLAAYLEGDSKSGSKNSMLNRLLEAAKVRATALIASWNALEGFAIARVLWAWAGGNTWNVDDSADMAERLKTLGLTVVNRMDFATAAYYHVTTETQRPGIFSPPPPDPADRRQRFAHMYHEERDAAGNITSRPVVSAAFRIRIDGSAVNAAICSKGEVATIRLLKDYTALGARFAFTHTFFVDFFGYRIDDPLVLNFDLGYGPDGKPAEIKNDIEAHVSDPYKAWGYLNLGGENYVQMPADAQQQRDLVPHYMLRKATNRWANEVRGVANTFVQKAVTRRMVDGKQVPFGDMQLSVADLLNAKNQESAHLLKAMVHVLTGSPRRQLLKKAIQEESRTDVEDATLQLIKEEVKERAADLQKMATLLAATLAYSAPSVFQAADALRELLDPMGWKRETPKDVKAEECALRLPARASFEEGGFMVLQAMAKRYLDETQVAGPAAQSPAYECFRPLLAKEGDLETVDITKTEVSAVIEACMTLLSGGVAACEEAAKSVGPSFRVAHARSLLHRMRLHASVETPQVVA